jgi:hypothetical protein
MAHNEAKLILTAKPKRSVFSDWLASISKTASMDASFHIVVCLALMSRRTHVDQCDDNSLFLASRLLSGLVVVSRG